MPIRSPNQLFAILSEHREPIEAFIERDLLKSCAVAVHKIQIKIGAPRVRVIHIRSENDLPAIWVKIRGKVCSAIMSKLFLIAAVGAHEHDFHFCRHYQIFCEEIFILRNLFWSLWTAGTPNDPLAILGMPGAAVIAQFMSKPPLLSAVQIHVVDFQIAVSS